MELSDRNDSIGTGVLEKRSNSLFSDQTQPDDNRSYPHAEYRRSDDRRSMYGRLETHIFSVRIRDVDGNRAVCSRSIRVVMRHRATPVVHVPITESRQHDSPLNVKTIDRRDAYLVIVILVIVAVIAVV